MHELLLQKSAFGVPDSSADGKNGAHTVAVGVGSLKGPELARVVKGVLSCPCYIQINP